MRTKLPRRPRKRTPTYTPLPPDLVRRVRVGLKMTQRELADVLGYAEGTIARAERIGAKPHMRFALIGLLASRGKPYGILWPDH